MNTLLDSTIEDILSGELVIVERIINIKAHYAGIKRVKARKVKFYYAKNLKNGSSYQINAKIRRQHEELLSKN